MYQKLYEAVGLMVENVGILGVAIIGLVLWATISTLCEKKKQKYFKNEPVDELYDFYHEE